MYCKRKRNAKVELGLKWLIVSHTGLIVTMERDYDKCTKKRTWMNEVRVKLCIVAFQFQYKQIKICKNKVLNHWTVLVTSSALHVPTWGNQRLAVDSKSCRT